MPLRTLLRTTYFLVCVYFALTIAKKTHILDLEMSSVVASLLTLSNSRTRIEPELAGNWMRLDARRCPLRA